LIARGARGLVLTAVGQQVLSAAESAEQSALEIERAATGTDSDVPAGRVRLTTLQDIADGLLGPILGELRRKHPKIRLDVWCTARVLNLAAGEADLAVRIGRPTETSLVARRLSTLVERPHVARSWLDEHGLAPEDVRDLEGRDVLLLLVEERWTDGLG